MVFLVLIWLVVLIIAPPVGFAIAGAVVAFAAFCGLLALAFFIASGMAIAISAPFAALMAVIERTTGWRGLTERQRDAIPLACIVGGPIVLCASWSAVEALLSVIGA